MKILFTTDHYPPHVNGIVTHIVEVKKELERRGHTVYVVTPRISKKHTAEKGVYYLPSFPFPLRAKDVVTVPFNNTIEKQILQLPIDIIHNHMFMTGYFGMDIAQKKHIPLVGTFHTFMRQYADWVAPWAKTVTHPVAHFVARDYFNEHDLVIAPSQKAVQELQKAKVKTPIKLLHNGINLERFQLANPEIFRKTFFIDPNRPLIILVGILEKGKNIELAIQSILRLHKKLPAVQCAIIGHGMLRKNLEKKIFSLGLSRHIFITGFLSQEIVASATKAADIVLFTSDTDNFPTVLLEALAAGKPIVAIKDTAVVELVKDKENGLITRKNPTAIATALLSLLTTPKTMHRYGEVSARLSQQFSLAAYVDALEKVYNTLI